MMGLGASRSTRAARAQVWRDVAALLDPAARLPDPLLQGRELDWHGIYALAAGQLVAPTLHAVLSATPERWNAVPPEVQQALTELHRLNTARNAHMRTVLRQTVQCLNAAGIEPLLLKGSIALLPGLCLSQYPHAEARMLGDLDLALHNASAEQAAAVLRAAGYSKIDGPPGDPLIYDRMHHLAPLADPSGGVSIELHRGVMAREVPAQALPLAAMRQDAQRLDWDGLRLWVPSMPHRVLHNVLHDAVTDEAYRSGMRSLRQLLEFARLREQPDAASLDWPVLLQRLDALGVGHAARAQLLVCSDLFAQPLPAGVLPGATARASARKLWLWVEHPGLWPQYRRVHRVLGLLRNAMTPHWYPSKWRQLRQMVRVTRQR